MAHDIEKKHYLWIVTKIMVVGDLLVTQLFSCVKHDENASKIQDALTLLTEINNTVISDTVEMVK